jgi:hypothetical protein
LRAFYRIKTSAFCSWCANIHKIAAPGEAAISFFAASVQKSPRIKMNFKFSMALAALLLIFSSCRKDVDQFIPLPGDPSPEPVEASLLGKVHGPGGGVLEGVEVALAGQTVFTDALGLYFLPGASAPEANAWVEARKDGYFPGYGRVAWSAGAEHRADLLLLPRTSLGIVPVEAGGTLEDGNDLRLDFPSQALTYPTGDQPTGSARVFAYWADPAVGSLPGGARGVDASGDPVFLTTYGMLLLELEDGDGLPLQLKAGSGVEWQAPVNSALPSAQELALWWLNPETGLWEEGPGVFVSGNLVMGQMDKTGYWNLAAASPLVQVRGWVFEPGGSPARAVEARISGPDGRIFAGGLTQSQGKFALDMPGGVSAELQLFDLCGEVRYSAEIPALSGNLSLNPVTWPASNAVQIEGRLLDCEEEPVSLGYAQVVWGDREVLIPLVDGVFSALVPACSGSSGTLIVYDLARQFQTPPLNFNGGSSLNTGDWILCNDSPEYLSFNLDGAAQYSDDPEISVAGGVTTISDSFLDVSFSFEGQSAGTFPVLMPGFQLASWSQGDLSALDITVNISRFDPPGGYVIGSFNGSMTALDATEHPVSGVFKLQRN